MATDMNVDENNIRLSQALVRERQSIVDDFTERITTWATEQGRDVNRELGMVGQSFMSQSERYRPRLHIYNWFKKAYAARHMELALAELEQDPVKAREIEAEPNCTRRNKLRMNMSNAQADLAWHSMDENRRAELEQEYIDSSSLIPGTYMHANNSLPSTPSKKKPKSMAQTRKQSMSDIVRHLGRTIGWADDHEFDIACYVADRHLRDYGGVLYEQLGTQNGLHFLTTISERGISGETLQVIGQARRANIFACDTVPEHREQHLSSDPVGDACPPVSKKSKGCKQRLASDIRANIRTKCNELLIDRQHHFVNIPQDPERFIRKLTERGLEMIIDPVVSFTLHDVLKRDSNPYKLESIRSALVFNRIRIRKVDNS